MLPGFGGFVLSETRRRLVGSGFGVGHLEAMTLPLF